MIVALRGRHKEANRTYQTITRTNQCNTPVFAVHLITINPLYLRHPKAPTRCLIPTTPKTPPCPIPITLCHLPHPRHTTTASTLAPIHTIILIPSTHCRPHPYPTVNNMPYPTPSNLCPGQLYLLAQYFCTYCFCTEWGWVPQ